MRYKNNPTLASLREQIKGIHGYKCVTCGNDGMWNNAVLTLHLDHIDGDNKNNNLDNLRFLCPNCHTQTATYGGKKRL